MSKSTLHLDLYPIPKRCSSIDAALAELFTEAVAKHAACTEIIQAKGGSQLKKRVLKFLQQKEIKAQYKRVQLDAKNYTILFVYFGYTKANQSSKGCGLFNLRSII